MKLVEQINQSSRFYSNQVPVTLILKAEIKDIDPYYTALGYEEVFLVNGINFMINKDPYF